VVDSKANYIVAGVACSSDVAGWRPGLVVTRWSWSTELLYVGPG